MNLGSFVDGLFAGAKSTAELMDAKNKLEIQYRQFADADLAKKTAEEQAAKEKQAAANMAVGQVWNPEGTDTIQSSTGSSTPPVPTEIKEGITGTRDPKARNAGASEYADQIASLVSKRESSDRPNIGYGGTDLTNAPAKPGYFGFPDWAGNIDPATGQRSHAAGLYQFQPDTWKQYAGPLGITDFSPESQRRVFNAAYLDQGIRPWASNRALIGDVAAAGLLGGAGAQVAKTDAGTPSALAGTPAPVRAGGTAPPDLEGQSAKVKTGPSPVGSPISTIIKAVAGPGVTPAQQANVPEGNMTMQPPISVPSPTPAAPPMRSSALDPASTAMATSAMSPPSMGSASSGSSAATTVAQTPSRPVLAQLRQSDQGGGMRPPEPTSRPGGGQQFAAGSKIIRLPDGTMVDGIGNIVRPAPSALYPTRTA